MEPVASAILLTLVAGASTVIGAFLGIINKRPSPRFISFMMATSAGVMVFLSFTEMFNEASEVLGMGTALLVLLGGMAVALVLDMVLPEQENVHEHLYTSEMKEAASQPSRSNIDTSNMLFHTSKDKFMKLGAIAALALFIHNIPEGLATFSASLLDVDLGLKIMVAIALHNIPEGICVAIPVFIATGSKKKAVIYSSVSGLAEPAGALIAWPFLGPFMTDTVLMVLLAFVAGIMIYISIDTLIPTAKSMEHKHTSVLGFVFGMAVMGFSITFLG